MFQVYYTNFGYTAQERFDTVEAAVAYGRSKGFEFTVYNEVGLLVGWWTVFGGWRTR